MKKDITYVALDDSKKSIVGGILRPKATEPELRQFPNEPKPLRSFFTRLQREGPVRACYEAGPSQAARLLCIRAKCHMVQVIHPPSEACAFWVLLCPKGRSNLSR